jgi:hypothetical protein
MGRPAKVAIAAFAACILGAGVWYQISSRALSGSAAMVACLPGSSATVAYLDLNAMRRSGLLDALAGSRAAEDADYRHFVEGTGFDYRRDLEAAAGSFTGGDAVFVLTGNFNWAKLRAYAAAQGGVCRDGFCRMKANSGQRWISFYPIRRGTMSLAFSSNEYAALNAGPGKKATIADLPSAPAWAIVPATALESAGLPSGTRSFTSPLASAEKIVFAVNPRDGEIGVDLDVTCASAAAASDLLLKLEGATNMLRKLIEREHQKPNPADISGVLTAGVFRREDRRVLGAWPLRREFVESLAGGAAH